jgi:hypothetical protein
MNPNWIAIIFLTAFKEIPYYFNKYMCTFGLYVDYKEKIVTSLQLGKKHFF